MSTPAWNVSGQYYETCNCDFVCPCMTGQLIVAPTKGDCRFAMAFQIERGVYGAIPLDGLGFIIVGMTPAAMAKGRWSTGVIVDASATDEQHTAIALIASGVAGGPMAAMWSLVDTFLGTESSPIAFERDGAIWSVTASNLVDMSATGTEGLDPSTELRLENAGHPAVTTLARAVRSHVHAFGIAWDELSGKNNGRYAPFSWKRAQVRK